jgi:surfeit locus 1 family protein
MIARLRAAGLVVPALTALFALAALIGLGTWQLQRKLWKERIIAVMTERARAAPVTNETWPQLTCPQLPPRSLDLDPCEFRPVRLTVSPPFGAERHIFIAVPRQPNGIGGPGYWVFVPMRLVGPAAGDVYVNRGFVPEGKKAPALRLAPPSVAYEISGVLRRAEPRGRFSNPNDVLRNVYFVRDPLELGVVERSGQSGPSPRHYYIDQTGPVPTGDLPYPLAGKLALPNRHLEYALTWFALAATLLGVFAAFARQRLRPAPAATAGSN